MSLIKLSGNLIIGFGSELGSSGSNLDPNFIHFEMDPLGVRFKLSIAKSLSVGPCWNDQNNFNASMVKQIPEDIEVI